MKRILANSIFLVVLIFMFYSIGAADSGKIQNLINGGKLSDTNNTCDENLWIHVYDPSRLLVIQKCIEVTGTVWEKPVAEGDADYHISIKLDSGQAFYLNHKNYELKDSCLIVEVICAVTDLNQKGKIKTTLLYRLLYYDLPGACDDYYNKIYIPKKGEHVRVKGPLIIDEGEYSVVAHGWQEIHPVNSIEVIN